MSLDDGSIISVAPKQTATNLPDIYAQAGVVPTTQGLSTVGATSTTVSSTPITASTAPAPVAPIGQSGSSTGNVAFDIVNAVLTSYGIAGLADKMTEIRTLYPEISSADLMTMLKYDKRFNAPYLERFSGNAQRIAAGLQPLDDATYLKNEAAYKKIFTAYGMNTLANQQSYANLIANDVSPDEANTRVTMAYDKVLNDKATLNAFNTFYPSIQTSDIAATLLDPTQQLPQLQRKVTAAEVGGQALMQGLQGSLKSTTAQDTAFANIQQGTLGAEALTNMGVTKAQAAQGYQNIAEVLPTAEKLSSIYGNTLGQYGQLQAEQEQFQGLASAKRARQQLSAAEQAQFSGSSGAAKGAFSTSYLNRQSAAGQI